MARILYKKLSILGIVIVFFVYWSRGEGVNYQYWFQCIGFFWISLKPYQLG